MLFYRPETGVAGDFIPFYWQGTYHLFYLRNFRGADGHVGGMPWYHVSTRDFVHYEEWGEAIPCGPADGQDSSIYTGCVVEHAGVFHIFYCGNAREGFARTGRPRQVVMHATSPDLLTWTKDPAFRMEAPEGFEHDDWRDPFVFWNQETGQFQMLITARRAEGPERTRGALAMAVSTDLAHWRMEGAFWAPRLYVNHECPDLFRMGDWWYLIYSTYCERHVTHYRMARSLAGPWSAPEEDAFDGPDWYAAKTAGKGGKRYLFGWIGTLAGKKDRGALEWGGNLAVHEVYVENGGALRVRMPECVESAFVKERALSPVPVFGNWRMEKGRYSVDASGTSAGMTFAAMGGTSLVESTITFAAGTREFGLLLRADTALNRYYQVRFEPLRQRFVIDCWPRPGEPSFLAERPLPMAPGHPLHVRAITEENCIVVYVNGETALSWRIYDHQDGLAGLFVKEGKACFENTTSRTTST